MSQISKQALKVDNSQSFPNNNVGAISPSDLRDYNVNVIDSLVDEDKYNVDSGSWNNSIDALEAFTSSQQPTFNALNSFTASQLNINSGYNTFTQSASGRLNALENDTANLEAFTSSINEIIVNGQTIGTSTRFFFNGFVSASIVPNVNGPIASITVLTDTTYTPSASFNAYTASTNAFTASTNNRLNSLESFSSSLDNNFVSEVEFSSYVTSSQTTFNSFSQSVDLSLDTINSSTGSYATTGSNVFTGNQNFTQPITASTITIQTGTVGNGINLFQDGLSQLRFYSGSTKTEVGTWVNMQTNPANGALAISSFPLNNHFVDFDVEQTASLFTAPIKGMIGNLNIASGVTIAGETLNLYDANPQLQLRANTQGSGSQYPGVNITVNPNVNPTDIYGGYGILREEDLPAGTTFLGMAANSYSPQYGGVTTPMIIANGNNPDGNDTAIAWTPDGAANHWKKSNFKYGVEITGSAAGNVFSASIVSSTASIDLNVSNFFKLELPNGVNTNINILNPKPGTTAIIEITNNGIPSASFSSNVKQQRFNAYAPTSGSSTVDLLSVISLTTSSVYVANSLNFV
jgi:hypothetical protein